MRTFRRMFFALLVACALLGLSPPALAYTVSVCIDWNAVYADGPGVGDDYVNTNTADIDAYGVKVKVDDGTTTVFEGYASDSTGCTANFTASGGVNYDVRVYGEASINGNTLYYKLFGSGLYSTVFDDYIFASNGTYTFDVPNGHLARVMGVLSYALKNRDLSVTGETINVWRNSDGASGPCPTTSCNNGGEIYYLVNASLPDHSTFKNVLAHEFGHKMMYLRGGVSSISKSYAADDATTSCPDESSNANSHSRNSVEYHSAAAIEGYAHYYASVVFNQVGGAGCWAYSHGSVNWDNTGGGGGGDGNIYDCDGPPMTIVGVTFSQGDYMLDQCGDIAGLANEYDYQRFFWDLSDKEPPSESYSLGAGDIADVIGDASVGWNAAYQTSYPEHLDNPMERMETEAAEFGTTWGDLMVENGVYR